MKRLTIAAVMLTILACALPVAPESVKTPSKVLITPTLIHAFAPATPEIQRVTGCWYLRQSPGGEIIDVVCNKYLVLLGERDGWGESTSGYICPRAWGAAAVCEVK